jgi:fucose 4-O-acetylase-like acetyltransferase
MMSTQTQRPDTLEPISTGIRSNVVDIVKGIAIILVAYGHTAQGMIHRGWWATPAAFFSEAFIYSFHMPAFFFIAGLFVIGSINKRGGGRFAREKLKTILYPYLLFVIISSALDPLVGRFKSGTTEFHWKTFLLTLADGEANWFLFALFFGLMLALLTVRVPAWMRFVAGALVGMMVPLSGPPLTNQSLREFCFLAAGMWVGTRIYRLEQMRTATAAIGFLILAAIQLAAIYLYGSPTAWTYIALGLTGTAVLFLLAKMLDKHWIGDRLAWVGRASLAVFLMSPFAQGATREVLSRVFHTHEVWLQLLLPTALATLLPAIVWYQQDRWRVGWLFQWPLS